MASTLHLTKLMTELVGTMALCAAVAFIPTCAARPVAIGSVLMGLVYIGGPVSGGHYNPAVTLAVLLRGGEVISTKYAGLYVVVQLVGGGLVGLVVWCAGAEWTEPTGPLWPSGVLSEVIVSFALCSVVLHTATVSATSGNTYYGLAIGFALANGAMALGSYSGGSFNPAVGIAMLVTNVFGEAGDASAVGVAGTRHAAPIFLLFGLGCFLAPLLGGVLAAGAFRQLARQEFGAGSLAADRVMLCKCGVEALGTAMLCFTVGACDPAYPLKPVAVGSTLMVMVYMGGWISGGHYNPAVTLAVYLKARWGAGGDLSAHQALLYVSSQVAGCAAGAVAAATVLGTQGEPAYPACYEGALTKAGAYEFFGTLILVLTVLRTASSGNDFSGLAIGGALATIVAIVGPTSGGAINPAVGMMGMLLMKEGTAKFALLYWICSSVAAVCAALWATFYHRQESAKAAVPELELSAR